MKSLRAPSRISSPDPLHKILASEFFDARKASELFDEFLRHKTYDRNFCKQLLAIAGQRSRATWQIRRLAVLMLEHQILKLDPDDLAEFDFLLDKLNLKQAPGLTEPVVRSVLREGYSTTDLLGFVVEFRRRLKRLNYVHDRISGRRTSAAAIRDFIGVSRRDCKLTLARYLFTPEEIVAEILRQLRITDGVKDLSAAHPDNIDDELKRALSVLPHFEGEILRRLCETANIYWVSETTSSEINSLVEYPLTTVVLTVKPPGSDVEFEIKRTGRRGQNALGVVYARGGYAVPPSHRLDGGDMLWLLQYEAIAAAKFGGIYRLVHQTEPPIAYYVSRATIYSVPTPEADVQTVLFFTEAQHFGEGFREMRVAMKRSVDAFIAEGNDLLPDMGGDLGLTAQFLGHVTPAQAILCGTTSFRLDKLALYLSSKGAETYFKGIGAATWTWQDERRLADELLAEVLGIYHPPKVRYQNYGQYVTAAFRVEENRRRADQIYLSLLQQVAKFWGTLLGIRGYSRGESFVARNVGLRSVYEGGQWRVKMIFMDHDAMAIPGPESEMFYAHGGVPNMAFDESFIWGNATPKRFDRSEVGCIQRIYRIGKECATEGETLARHTLKAAYRKTQHVMLNNPRLRPIFSKTFLERLHDFDMLVGGYFRMNGDEAAARRWKREMKKVLAAKGYKSGSFEAYMQMIEANRIFLERNRDIFDLESDNGEPRG